MVGGPLHGHRLPLDTPIEPIMYTWYNWEHHVYWADSKLTPEERTERLTELLLDACFKGTTP